MNLEAERLLDRIGLEILSALQEDGRITFSELGKRVGLSSPAISERVRRMEEAGIIKGYRAIVDPEKMGYPITAAIRLSASRERQEELLDFLRERKEVLLCERVTGADSYLLKVIVTNVSHLEALLDSLSKFGQPVTSIVLSVPIDYRPIQKWHSGDERL
ncbi:MAG: Lrp/AsnC family transcriptional regulator [Synergistaceae bacterium]|nr:Lrp/AsnC family transcriptional regulator [Synergistaceae bacterium]